MRLLRAIEDEIMSRLFLGSNRDISFYLRLPSSNRLKYNVKYLVLTAHNIMIMNYHLGTKKGEKEADIPISELNEINVKMEHYNQKEEPLLYIASTKSPVLSLKTINDSYVLSLKGVLSVKKKINQLVEYVKKVNPDIKENLDYRKGDLSEAHNEIFFEGVDNKGKKRIAYLTILLIIVLSIAIWKYYSLFQQRY